MKCKNGASKKVGTEAKVQSHWCVTQEKYFALESKLYHNHFKIRVRLIVFEKIDLNHTDCHTGTIASI